MIVGIFLSILVCFQAPGASQDVRAGDVNHLKSIRARGSAIEIEVQSSREFPVGGQIPVLLVGTKEFAKSRHPEDGSLNTLIFTLEADEFEQLPDGEAVTVGFGRGKAGGDVPSVAPLAGRSGMPETNTRWKFGTLNKSLLIR